ncbi:TIGR02099 family protein [Pseudoalteromonas sp. S4488]|uniref:YhdP family protein n=1 Tax=unclassified Pseudoalteromonas TaxID=194690 RepID=UPI0010230D5E|nr:MULTISPECIES: YhdP family protein [unclassified Pseudoalteromonas]RZF79746.1 TIGR02099 family protein [Pseudoalteromonas sp. CO109Y]TMO33232.1 TIGR02099 family protein [Pseudoalteromonas sp. S4491]TMO40324.1 TIGR02099 family protein [Pseudoalteromonas sp. S4488]
MKAKTVCFYCLRKLWQVFAITLVLLAVIVSVVKYSLPYANDYKDDIEAFLYERFDVNLAIGSISASWHGQGPALVIEDISFEDNQTSPIALTIDKASLEVNLWESVKTRQLKSNYFVINGFHADVDLPTMLDLGNNQQTSNFEQKELIEGLFLGETGHFAVQDSSLNFTLNDGKERKLILENIVWQNTPEQHQGSGTLALPGISVGSFDARMALNGSTLETMAGDIYVQAANVDVSKWLAQYINTDKQQLTSDINLQTWFSLEKGLISDVKVQWLPSFINWQQNQEAHQISLSEGGFHLFPKQNGWRLKSTGLTFESDLKQWPTLQFEAQLGDKSQIWLKQFDFALLAKLSQLSNFEVLAPFLARQPNGQLSDAYLELGQQDNWQLWFQGEQINWLSLQGIPGGQAIRVDGLINQSAGRIQLYGENNQLLTNGSFSQDIAYNQLNVELDLHHYDDGWRISSNNIWLDNDEVTVAAEMMLSLTDEPRLDLYAEAYAPDAKVAGHYFPLPVMSEKLVNYLNGAIKGGEVNKAQVLFSGPFKGFPFKEQQGQFEVLANVENAKYKFSPSWPEVEDANVILHFENERMDIYSKSGKLVNLALGESVHVSIADLMNADILKVAINKRAHGDKLNPFFTATPLAKPLASVFEVVQPQGEATADIELLVNLRSGHVDAIGEVELANIPVYLAQPGITLNHMTGIVKFNNDKIDLKNAKADWMGMPLTANYNSENVADTYRAEIAVKLGLEAEPLIEQAHGLLAGYLSGQSDVDINVSLNFLPNDFNYRADVSGNLIGVTSKLPAPYNKSAEQKWPLTAVVQGDRISNLITANVDEQLFFNAILDNGEKKFSNAHLILGAQDLGLNREGFAVSIDLPETEIVPWFGLIDQIIALTKVKSDAPSVMPAFNNVTGKFNKLALHNIDFNDFEFRLAPKQSDLELKLNAKELRADALIPTGETRRPIQIFTDYLRINFNEVAEQTEQDSEPEDLSWLTRVPAIEFNCEDCKVAEYQLDKIKSSLVGENDKLLFTELVIDKGDHVLRGKGQFADGQTRFSGNLQSDDIGELFDEFDITTTVKDSDANIKFDLAWQGAPYSFDVPSLAGELDWRLGEGHLAEISDGGARVFSLLSLDSLVRKLKLDFRDVFSKGFFYNSMQGTMQLEKGIAYTQDTKLDGVPADLTIKGHTNLNTFEIDYDLAVAPQVTSSIPVIVAWMVNPVSGLAALAIDKVIHSARVISEINFKVTGSMNDPVVKEVDRKSREVTLPQAAQSQPQSSTQLKLKDAASSASLDNNEG